MGHCVFCEIIKGNLPSSKIYEDDRVIAILDLRQIRPGHSMVIPKIHVDHFIDLEDSLAQHICHIGNAIGHNILKELNPARVGFAVAGFGIAHAHYHIVPMHEAHDVTSSQYAVIENGIIDFKIDHIPISDPQENQRLIKLLKL
jgi:histidine triad (HIT) family protein